MTGASGIYSGHLPQAAEKVRAGGRALRLRSLLSVGSLKKFLMLSRTSQTS